LNSHIRNLISMQGPIDVLELYRLRAVYDGRDQQCYARNRRIEEDSGLVSVIGAARNQLIHASGTDSVRRITAASNYVNS